MIQQFKSVEQNADGISPKLRRNATAGRVVVDIQSNFIFDDPFVLRGIRTIATGAGSPSEELADP